jgi:nitrogen fixation NifU-like protein
MYEMYRENILDHAKHPRNHGALDPCDVDFEANNHVCGDRLRLTLRIDESDRITEVGWDGDGCAISQASASMLGEEIIGKTLNEIQTLDKQDIFDLLGISLTPNRMKCALLSLKVLKVGLAHFTGTEVADDEDE